MSQIPEGDFEDDDGVVNCYTQKEFRSGRWGGAPSAPTGTPHACHTTDSTSPRIRYGRP